METTRGKSGVSGFTLSELLCLIVLIAILSAIIVPISNDASSRADIGILYRKDLSIITTESMVKEARRCITQLQLDVKDGEFLRQSKVDRVLLIPSWFRDALVVHKLWNLGDSGLCDQLQALCEKAKPMLSGARYTPVDLRQMAEAEMTLLPEVISKLESKVEVTTPR